MDMTQFAGSESKYLKASDLGGKSIKVIIDGVDVVEFDDDNGKYTKPAVKFKGKEKALICNATNIQELGFAYGFDSDSWVGKTVGLSVKHYPKFGKDGIILTAIDKPQKFGEEDIPF